jgi:hypothetical protein
MPSVDVMIAGKGPFRFIVGSGSVFHCIRRGLAAELGLVNKSGLYDKLFGRSTGSINHEEKTAKYPCDSVSLGGVTLPPLVLESVDIPDGADGILGTGLFTWRSVEIDLTNSMLRFYEDDSSPDLFGFTSIPDRRDGSIAGDPGFIIATATFGGMAMECMINTGSNPDLYLTSKFVRKYRLWDRYAGFEKVPINGNPGYAWSMRGIIDGFQLGSQTFDNVTVYLGDPHDDDNVGDLIGGANGVIGMGLLQRCDLFIQRNKGLYIRKRKL